MNRSTGRWLVLTMLLAAVVGLGFYNSISNERLIEELRLGNSASFASFSERQDAYIFLQSVPTEVRLTIAENLGDWTDSRAAKLAVRLVPDPDPAVRAALIASLEKIAARHPDAVAGEFDATGAAESAALIEAGAAEPLVGLKILRATLAKNPTNVNAYLLAKRIGLQSQPVIISILETGSEDASLLAADVLVGLNLKPRARKAVAEAAYRRFTASDSQAYRDRLFPKLAAVAPPEAAEVFQQIARDRTAPSYLRVAATKALSAIGDEATLDSLSNDPDTAVAAAAASR